MLKNKEHYVEMGYFDKFEAMDRDIQKNYAGKIL